MEVMHARTGKKLRLRRAHRVFGQERETMDEAFPGDIIGLVNPGEFRLGDTICDGEPVNFEPLPQFSPEHFAILRCQDTLRRKQFERGLEQLLEEGAIQMFTDLEPPAANRFWRPSANCSSMSCGSAWRANTTRRPTSSGCHSRWLAGSKGMWKRPAG